MTDKKKINFDITIKYDDPELKLYKAIMENAIQAGSWRAIKFELKNGNALTVIDEIWHSRFLEWFWPDLHYRFCYWLMEKYKCK